MGFSHWDSHLEVGGRQNKLFQRELKLCSVSFNDGMMIVLGS